MKRLTRAIAEIESFRKSLPMLLPSDFTIHAMCNTALMALRSAEAIMPAKKRKQINKVDVLIEQINDEIREET